MPKRRYPTAIFQSAITQKTSTLTFTAVKASNLASTQFGCDLIRLIIPILPPYQMLKLLNSVNSSELALDPILAQSVHFPEIHF